MDTLIQDLRFAVRTLIKNPSLALTVLAVIALSTGVNSAVFSVISTVLLRPLPFKDSDRITQIWETDRNQGVSRAVVSPANYFDWQEQNHVFQDMAAWRFWYFNLSGGQQPERVQGLLASANFFSLLGARPAIGRTFSPDEATEGRDRVVVISDALWRRRFASDPNVIGQTVSIDDRSYAVIGVMPPEFKLFKVLDRDLDLWAPLVLDRDKANRADHSINVYGRIDPSAPLAQARAQMDAIAARLEQQHPDTNSGRGVRVLPLREVYAERIRPTLLLLLSAVCLLLLIACANVANLLLGRAVGRQKEIAIRMALGAGRARILRQLLSESLLLALAGGLAGLMLAMWALKAFDRLIPNSVAPRLDGFTMDGRVLGYTLCISLLTGLLCGLAPAVQSSGQDVSVALKEGGPAAGGVSRGRLRGLFIVSEVFLTVMLLASAGLMIRSSMHLQQFDRGFDHDGVLTAQIWLPASKYSSAPQVSRFYDQVLDKLNSAAGVESVGAVDFLPLSRLKDGFSFTLDGAPMPEPGNEPSTSYSIVDGNYFGAMKIPLLAGRLLTKQDRGETVGAVVISQAAARQFWPGDDPIGRRIIPRFPKTQAPWRPISSPASLTVVGVVGDIKEDGLTDAISPQMYVSSDQFPSLLMNFVVRTRMDPDQFAPVLKAAVTTVDRDQPIFNLSPMNGVLSDRFSQTRVVTLLLGTFAVLALILAISGVYAVISYTTASRNREIGVRVALGATNRDIIRLIVGQGLSLVLVGICVGLVGAYAAGHLLSGLLFGVSASDPPTFLVVSVTLICVGLVASWIPARRAIRISPLQAMRSE